MSHILIVYGSTEGHTTQIADRMRLALESEGHQVTVRNARQARDLPVEDTVAGIIVGGSIHRGEHQTALREFVREHRARLGQVPSTFFSVSLTAAHETEESRADAEACVERFVREAGWQPPRVELIAGALVYSQYNFFMRHMMRLIVSREGIDTDTAHDYDYTDWARVEEFAREFGREVAADAEKATTAAATGS